MEQNNNRSKSSRPGRNRNNHNGKGSPYKPRQNRQNPAPKPEAKARVRLPEAGSMLTLMGDDGLEYQFDVLASWTGFETKKRYVIYTDHSMDLDGNVQFYAAICQIADGELEILPVESDADWEIVEAAAEKLR